MHTHAYICVHTDMWKPPLCIHRHTHTNTFWKPKSVKITVDCLIRTACSKFWIHKLNNINKSHCVGLMIKHLVWEMLQLTVLWKTTLKWSLELWILEEIFKNHKFIIRSLSWSIVGSEGYTFNATVQAQRIMFLNRANQWSVIRSYSWLSGINIMKPKTLFWCQEIFCENPQLLSTGRYQIINSTK